MRRALLFGMCVLAVACEGDVGPSGPTGPEGPGGPEGPQGVPGPLTDPVVITEVSPAWGSWRSQVRIHAENLRADAADHRVLFDGLMAPVVAVGSDFLDVTPPARELEGPLQVVVNVEAGSQVSNGAGFLQVPSGTAGAMAVALPTRPHDAVELGTAVFVAAYVPAAPTGGLFRVDEQGWAERVWAPPWTHVGAIDVSVPEAIYDGPTALATDGSVVYVATTLGSVLRYDPGAGWIDEVLAWSPLDVDLQSLPAIPGLAMAGEHLAVVFRDTVFLLDPDTGERPYELDLPGARDVAWDGGTLYATAETSIVAVEDPAGTPNRILDWATAGEQLHGLTVVDTDVIAGGGSGQLYGRARHAIGADDSGPLNVAYHAEGYTYPCQGLAATASNDLLVAQPDASAVRRIRAGETNASTLAVGFRVHFGAARMNDRWFFTSVGDGMFGSGPDYASSAIQDGAVIELAADGRSRVVVEQRFPAGILVDGSELLVSDCFASRIDRVDPDSGVVNNVLDQDDGLLCPGGMVLEIGTLYYANATIPELGGGEGFVGRLPASGANEPNWATGLPELAVYLTQSSGTLISMALETGPEGINPTALFDVSAGGAAQPLVPASAAGALVTVGASPETGQILGCRFPFGDLVEIDVDTGAVHAFGSSNLHLDTSGWSRNSFFAGSFALEFAADGTLVLPDWAQDTVVMVAP